MTRDNTEICPCCEQEIHTYKFSLTKSLTTALKRIASCRERVFNSKTLRDNNVISSSDFTNITHLRYLYMVEKVCDDVGERGEGRLWRITDAGVRYLNGHPATKWVRVRLGEIIETSEETVRIHEAEGHYQPPEYWAGVNVNDNCD